MRTEWFYVGQDIQIQLPDHIRTKNISVTELFDSLDDLVTADEINPNTGEHWLCADGNVFTFTGNDWRTLREKGWCRIYNIGSIDDHIDLDFESHREFKRWYYGRT